MNKKKRKNQKKKKKNQKTKRSLLSFFKNYIAVISFGVSGIGLFLNIGILYFQRAKQTKFEINYYIQEVDKNSEKLTGRNDTILRHMSYPTYNNEINQIIHEYQKELKSYYIVYLVLEQVKEQEASEVFLTYKKRGTVDVETFDSKQLKIDNSKEKIETISLPGIFHQREGIKIPVAICEFERNKMYKRECILEEINAIEISFQNNYLFSKQTQKIREMYLNLVTFEGEIINGRGGPFEKIQKEWYEK